ncbi:phosphoprotein phosphatase-like protein [Podospora appendiculata]|uniref:Phosphoprotein phosphatase-like protein n=1 Tax=Podospora appendiculata TaxID=314037 RepID=A0AAE0X8W5_9PEZI|nr:phosphoprotein phosphatase-like protein [Podospora appendiculata]
MATIGSLQRLSASSLSDLILAQQAAIETSGGNPTIAIIDVRDDDYIGGHIKGAQNFPSRTLEALYPTLVRQLQDKETVVFHCALSQVRGPSAALRYIRERDRILAAQAKRAKKAAATGEADTHTADEKSPGPIEQKVYVLDRGFVGWQELFGEDSRLTEGYSKELWQDGYWG